MIKIGTISAGGGSPLFLIAGPCVVEGRDMILRTASRIREEAVSNDIPVIFKSSYKKANRTSGSSFRGLGMDEALKVLEEVRREVGIPVLTDVHTESDVA